MKKHYLPKDCLRVAIQAHHPGQDIKALAEQTGVSRPTVYAWKTRLGRSGHLVFGSRSLEKRVIVAEAANKRLREWNAALAATLTRAGIKPPPEFMYADDEDLDED